MEHFYPTYPDLGGRSVVVTGGSKGIGLAIATAFVQNGARVFLIGRSDEAAMAEALQGLRARPGARVQGHLGDLAKSSEVKRIFAQILSTCPQVDVLINNAGGFASKRPMTEIDDEEWLAMQEGNLFSAFYCSREVIPGMVAAGWGCIVGMSSQAALNPPWPTGAHYAAAKGGMLGLARHMAKEFGSKGVRSNIVIPGTTATPRFMRGVDPVASARILETIPAGRFAHTWEPASVVLFLASEGAGYINGATIECNGGRSM